MLALALSGGGLYWADAPIATFIVVFPLATKALMFYCKILYEYARYGHGHSPMEKDATERGERMRKGAK